MDAVSPEPDPLADSPTDHCLGLLAAMPWPEVETAAIVTTDAGPLADDLFWSFALLDGKTIELPGPWISPAGLHALQGYLPGLDLLRVVRAMGSTMPRTFCVWRRDRSPHRVDDAALVARFVALAGRVGADAGALEPVARGLLASWSDTARRYHDLEHLRDCLADLDALQAADDAGDTAVLAARPALELALWYHDAVYDTAARDSEERSAERLIAELAPLGVESSVVADAARLVRATAHLGRAPDAVLADDAALIVDIDLAILAQPRQRFFDFDDGILEEYAATWAPLLRWARRRFLRRLLASKHIYRTAALRLRYEAAARANLQALLASGRYGLWAALWA